jgi:hypothetical protein
VGVVAVTVSVVAIVAVAVVAGTVSIYAAGTVADWFVLWEAFAVRAVN